VIEIKLVDGRPQAILVCNVCEKEIEDIHRSNTLYNPDMLTVEHKPWTSVNTVIVHEKCDKGSAWAWQKTDRTVQQLFTQLLESMPSNE
jgi:hypothetical protein